VVPFAIAEEPEAPPEEQAECAPYSPSRIEQMGPVMREKIIIQILVKAIRKLEQ